MEKQLTPTTKNICSGLCCTKIEHFGVNIGKNQILQNVNIHIHCGELTALIGPNGAGKSTLFKAMLGELSHTGELKYLSSTGRHNGHPIIGYVPQTLSLDRSSPANVMDLFMASGSRRPAWLPATQKTKHQIIGYLERTGAGYLVDRRLGALSGGELQRVLLAMALQPIPDLLLLDEPVTGVDQNGLKAFYDQVSSLRAMYDLSIIMVTHDLDLIPAYADRVVLLNKTVLAAGAPNEVFSSKAFYNAFPAHYQSTHKTMTRASSETKAKADSKYTIEEIVGIKKNKNGAACDRLDPTFAEHDNKRKLFIPRTFFHDTNSTKRKSST